MRSFIKKIIILLKRIFTIPSCIFSLLIGVCSASTFALFSNSKDAKLDYFASLMTQLSSYSNTEYGLIMDIEMGGNLGRLDVDAACHWCRNYSRYFFSNGAQVIRTIYDANLHPYVRVNDFFDSTPSLLISPIFSTHLNPNGVPTHDFYEVHFMFEELDMDFSGFDNFCCIRQSDADFLISKYPEKYSSYEDLIGEPLGLEAGSKAELMVVLAHAGRTKSVIVCNGYKDREYIRMALNGEKIGHKVYIVIEKLSELRLAIEEAAKAGKF